MATATLEERNRLLQKNREAYEEVFMPTLTLEEKNRLLRKQRQEFAEMTDEDEFEDGYTSSDYYHRADRDDEELPSG